MVPGMSFNRSNRDTCTMVGLSLVISYLSSTLSISHSGSSMFLSLSGSIDGGTRNFLVCISGLAKSGAENIDASYFETNSLRKFQTRRSGLETSMWHLHIHVPPSFARIMAAGWGSCMNTKSPSISISSELISFQWRYVSKMSCFISSTLIWLPSSSGVPWGPYMRTSLRPSRLP